MAVVIVVVAAFFHFASYRKLFAWQNTKKKTKKNMNGVTHLNQPNFIRLR